jgi:hypothetical protein
VALNRDILGTSNANEVFNFVTQRRNELDVINMSTALQRVAKVAGKLSDCDGYGFAMIVGEVQ